MNDHDAMTAVNAVIDQYVAEELSANSALYEIAKICGTNAKDHEAAK